ncbi:MAG: InlB B-repeat-containing protein [Oscillospiraceae bacterium]
MINKKKVVPSALRCLFFLVAVTLVLINLNVFGEVETGLGDSGALGVSLGESEEVPDISPALGESIMIMPMAFTRPPATSQDFLSSSFAQYNANGGTGSQLFSGVGQYRFQIFGNSNVWGFDYSNKHEYINVHPDRTALGYYNSTSMTYVQEGVKIKKAILYMTDTYYNWSGAKTDRSSTFIEGPKGGRILFDDGYRDVYFDITDFIKQEGSGEYWGINIDCQSSSASNYDIDAGWHIIVIEEDEDFNYRQMSLRGYNLVMQNTNRYVKASDGYSGSALYPPASGITGQYLISVGGGNNTYAGDTAHIRAFNSLGATMSTVQIQETTANRPSSNFFRGIISKNRQPNLNRNPTRVPANIDLAVSEIYTTDSYLPAGLSDIAVGVATSTDRIYLYAIGAAVDIGVPDIGVNNYIGGTTDSSAEFAIGSKVDIDTTFDKATNGFSLDGMKFSVVLPENTSLDTSSVTVTGVTSSSYSYDPLTRTLTVPFTTGDISGVGISYSINTTAPLTSSTLRGRLTGNNVLPDNTVTDMEITLVATELYLMPGYPVTVRFIDTDTSTIISPDLVIDGAFDDPYSTSPASIYGYTLVLVPDNAMGSHIDAPQTVLYEYSRTAAVVYVTHVTDELPPVTLGTETVDGFVDDPYSTRPKDFPGFSLAILPDNVDGSFADTPTYVEYIYSRNSYQVNFHGNGADSGSMSSQTYAYEESKALSANTFGRTGYDFQGWAASPTGAVAYTDGAAFQMTGTANVDLYAVWKVQTYKVTFDAKGGSPAPSNIAAQAYDTLIPAPGTMSRAGHTFSHWKDASDNSTWNFASNKMPARDLVLEAVWTTDSYGVTFDAKGGSPAPSNIPSQAYGSKITEPAAMLKEGHSFSHWEDASDNSTWNFATSTMPDRNLTLEAVWTVNNYTVTFDPDSGTPAPTNIPSQIYGTLVPAPAAMTRAGHTFSHWVDISDGSTWNFASDTMPARSLSLKAVWTVNRHKVTFDAVGGTPAPATIASQAYGTQITAPAAMNREGYSFSHWVDASDSSTWNFTSNTMPDRDLELKAVWTINSYSVTFDPAGGSPSPANIPTQAYGSLISAPGAMTKEGHDFLHWVDASDNSVWNFASATMPARNLTLRAVWSTKSYSVTFDVDSGAPVPANIPAQLYNTKITEPTSPVKTGYTFLYWVDIDNGNAIWNFATGTMPARNLNLKAEYVLNQNSVVFLADGGTPTPANITAQNYGTVIPSPAAMTRTGYDFVNWVVDDSTPGTGVTKGSVWNFATGTMPDHSLVLRAVWNIRKYQVTFDADGGTPAPATIPGQEYNSFVPTPAAVSRVGYTLLHWIDVSDNSIWSFAANRMPDRNLDLKAVWSINSHPVTFLAEGGTPAPADIAAQTFGTAVPEPAAMARTGHTFLSWKDTATGNSWNYSADTMPDRPLTLQAEWSINSYQVTYHANDGGNGTFTKTVQYDKIVGGYDGFSRTGYEVEGWYLDSTLTSRWDVERDRMPDYDIDLYANWVKKPFTVVFHANGGAPAPDDLTVLYDELVTEPGGMTKKGHSFDGWYTSESFGAADRWDFASDRMPAETLHLYANWTPNPYTVTFLDSNARRHSESFVVLYGSALPIPDLEPFNALLLKKDRDVIVAWKTADGYYWDFSKDMMPDYDLELFAVVGTVPDYNGSGTPDGDPDSPDIAGEVELPTSALPDSVPFVFGAPSDVVTNVTELMNKPLGTLPLTGGGSLTVTVGHITLLVLLLTGLALLLFFVRRRKRKITRN